MEKMEIVKVDDLSLNFAMWRGTMTINMVFSKKSSISTNLMNLREIIRSVRISEKSGGLLLDILLWMHYLRVSSVLTRRSKVTDILFGAESISYEIRRYDPATFRTSTRISPSFLNNGASFYIRDTISNEIAGKVEYIGNCGVEPVTAQEAGDYFQISPGIAILAEYDPHNKESKKPEGATSTAHSNNKKIVPHEKSSK